MKMQPTFPFQRRPEDPPFGFERWGEAPWQFSIVRFIPWHRGGYIRMLHGQNSQWFREAVRLPTTPGASAQTATENLR